MRRASGFTLIELIAVIVILGILAVTAIPKYLDMTAAANAAAVKGVTGALSGAAALDYAARTMNSTAGAAISACQNAANALASGLPAGYTILTAATVATGSTVSTCVVTNASASANFTIISIT